LSDTIPQPSPAEFREFAADERAARQYVTTAKDFMTNEDAMAKAQAGMKRSWDAARELGKILKRMYDGGVYLHVHGNWTKCCRELGVTRQNSHRLMSYADREPQSFARIKIHTTAPEDDPEADLPDDPALDPESMPVDGLGEALDQRAAASAGTLDDTGAAPPKVRDAAWLERQLAPAREWLRERQLAKAVGHLDAAVNIAKLHES
jgi:hypothetical protein